MKTLIVTSPCFEAGGLIPLDHTGYGKDLSPELHLEGLCKESMSVAIIMNDMGHPIPAYNHWVIWNIPAQAVIPGNIPQGKFVGPLGDAVQGRGYGKNGYKGPKPPLKWSHIYHFNVFVLDCILNVPATSRKKDLLAAMQGHILQQAVLAGHYR